MKPINRERMFYAYLAFIFVWYVGTVLAVKYLGISVMEGVGLGTAGGVFLGAFKDMFQFFWRRASPQEEALGNASTTTEKPKQDTTAHQ